MLLSSSSLMLLSLLGGLLLLSSIGLVHAEPKVISMETKRMSRSALHRRDPADVDLRNGIVLYAIDVSVGTPAQNIALQIDTTNYDTWLPGPELASDLNVAAGGIYDPAKSDSKSNVSASGLDRADAQGGLVTDDLTIEDYKLPKLCMGVAEETDYFAGQLGLGILNLYDDAADTKKNSTVLDAMVETGLIKRRAYSMWLNTVESDKGSIIFGGVDTEKYEGDLYWIYMSSTAPSYGSLVGMTYTLGHTTIAKNGMTKDYTKADNKEVTSTATETEGAFATETPATSNTADPTEALVDALDFGSLLVTFDARAYVSLIPSSIFEPLAELFGATQIGNSQLYTLPCSFDKDGSIGFQFDDVVDGPVIDVPFSELAFPIPDWMQPGSGGFPFADEEEHAACGFGLSPLPTEGALLLGQTFLRSAYIAFDYEDMTVGLANARFNVTKSNIVEIVSDGLASTVTSSAASKSSTASVTTKPASATRAKSSAASTLESHITTASVATPGDHSFTQTPTGSASPNTSFNSTGTAIAFVAAEGSILHLLLFALCGSIFMIAAMLF